MFFISNWSSFLWYEECQKAFELLKQKKNEYNFILSYPHKEGKFILDTVACLYDIGAVLSQIQIENCEEI